ncbi:unnamed protein product [Rhizopus stolonifer]
MSTAENSDYKFNYEVNRDLVYYFDENQVETIYTQPGTNRKTRHHILVTDLSTEKLWIKRVLNCRLYGEPKLLIVCGDSTNKICFFWYCVIAKTSKAIDFETRVVGDITQAKITKAPFEVDYVYKAKVPEKKMCYALVLGMQDGSSILFLLNIDHLSSISVSFKYLNQEEGDGIGHVTSIYILPQDVDDKRMGHHDPQILLGYSKGAIRAYRFRATVYSFKASRIRSPIDLSEFTEFPGYPITHLSCARTYNSLKCIVSFAQEKPNDPKFENTKSYVKLIEFNGSKKNMLKVFYPPIPSASIVKVHLMSHYEDDIDFTIVFYSSLTHAFTISVWYLNNKQIMTHTLEKEITQSSCLERLEPTERTEPDDHYFLRNPEKVIELAFPSQAIGLKRKAALDFFKESLEVLEFPNKREKLLRKTSERTEPDYHYFLRNPEKAIEPTFPSQAVGLKRKATVDFFKESLEVLEFPNKREKLLHKNSPLDDDDDDDKMGICKDEKEKEIENELAQDKAQKETEDVDLYEVAEVTIGYDDSVPVESQSLAKELEAKEDTSQPLITDSKVKEVTDQPLATESEVTRGINKPLAINSEVEKESAVRPYLSEINNSLTKEPEMMEGINNILNSEIMKEIKEPLPTESEVMEEIMEPLYAESQVMEESLTTESDAMEEIEENDQEYEDEKVLDAEYAEEIVRKEQAYLDSLVFQDGDQYGDQYGDQDDYQDDYQDNDQNDEKEISGEETIDEESKKKEEGFVAEDEKEKFESCAFLQKDPFVHLIKFENNEIRDEELKGKETDGEAIDGSVFSQDENKHREIFENGDEFEGYQEDQIKEDYDEYFDAEEGYDGMENVEETEKEVEDIVCLSNTTDQSQNVSVASEVYPEYDEDDYVDCPGEEENLPMDYDYDYDEYSSAIEEDDDEQKIEPQNGSINLISDSDDKEMDEDENSSAQLPGTSDNEDENSSAQLPGTSDNEDENSLAQLPGTSDNEEDETSNVLGPENIFVEERVIQGPAPASALAKLVASYNMDFYKWGRRKC